MHFIVGRLDVSLEYTLAHFSIEVAHWDRLAKYAALRLGKRNNEIMSEVAADMTDQEIRAVADWYSKIKIDISEVN